MALGKTDLFEKNIFYLKQNGSTYYSSRIEEGSDGEDEREDWKVFSKAYSQCWNAKDPREAYLQVDSLVLLETCDDGRDFLFVLHWADVYTFFHDTFSFGIPI
jgi:hypothetical protein